MSQPNTINQNVPNGIPSHLNGVDSSHSSRDSSPSTRMQASLNAPSRGIPASQLPPMKSNEMNRLVQNYAGLQLNHGGIETPASSPKLFDASTPVTSTVQENAASGFNNQVLSPIGTGGFTHSATSHFSNVPLGKTEEETRNGAGDGSEHEGQVSSQRINFQSAPQQPGLVRGLLNQKLPHQNSLPATNTPRPVFQSSLSQPRMTVQVPQSVNVNSAGSMNTNVTGLRHPTGQRSNFLGQNSIGAPLSQTSQGVYMQPTSQLSGYQNHGIQRTSPFPVQGQGQVTAPLQPQGQVTAPLQHQGQVAPPLQNQGQVTAPLQPQRQVTAPLQHQGQATAPLQHPGQVTAPLQPQGQVTQMSVRQPVNNVYPKPVLDGFVSTPNQVRPSMHSNRYPTQPKQYQQPVEHQQLGVSQQRVSQQQPGASHLQNQQQLGVSQQPNQQQQLGVSQQQMGVSQQPLGVSQQPLGVSQQPMRVSQQPIQQARVSQQPRQMQYQQTQFQPQNYNFQTYPSQQPGILKTGFNKLWGGDNVDLLQCPNILPPDKVEIPKISLGNEILDEGNCSPDIFRCTVNKIPENNSLLQKSRLPLGILIHPFRDLDHLSVIQCNTIVRCRACRTYINPFVFFVDNKRWKCNLCYRVNELSEEFQYDPVTKTYGDPSRRPEVKNSTIEYIAPAEYMLRPPQPAVYLFLLDISRAAIESGYLHTLCNILTVELRNLPGDKRTHIGFIAYDSALHFFSLAEGLSQPHEMTVLDVDDIFLPCPDNLLVNLQDRIELINDLLAHLPTRYNNSYDTGSALGAALQAAHKLMHSTGGRVTIFQASLPTVGPGGLLAREDPSQRAGSEAQHLNPANDFYKRLALDCSGQQIAVDLFVMNSQYVDLATISGISRFSGGCIHHFPLFKASRGSQNEVFERSLRRYLTRKIGFEAVMRIRCTRGLSIHTFHGNFFVRSTDLLSLPNVNPDAGFGMQVAIEESLSDVNTVCFQAALLYTSSKGERRIRVHTMCLPVTANLSDLINSADQQCIVGLLSKMAVDRSMLSSLSDAREAFINVAIDILSSYKLSQNVGNNSSGLLAPNCLRLLPLYISALLKNPAFRTGVSTRLDDRLKAMIDMKTRPLPYLIKQIYPDLYPLHKLHEAPTITNEEGEIVPQPQHLQLTARSIDSNGAYLLDTGDHIIIFIGPSISEDFLRNAINVPDYNSIPDQLNELPYLDNELNRILHAFINYLNEEKPFASTIQIMRDNSPSRGLVLEKLIEDRLETALSYHEFLQHLKTQVK